MDAINAFNSLSRSATIWNCRVLWFNCSRFVFKSYRGFSILFIPGTIPADPLAMLLYSLVKRKLLLEWLQLLTQIQLLSCIW